MRGRLSLILTVGVTLSGCALKSDIRRVEDRLAQMREDAARADSARAVTLARVLDQLDGFHTEVRDSLSAQRLAILNLQGEFRTDLTQVLRNLVAMQEVMGQSQAGLQELRRELDARMQALVNRPPPVATDSMGAPVVPPAEGPGPEELFSIGMQQYRQSSVVTARTAFQVLIDRFPNHERAPDAMFFTAESWEQDQPDSAAVGYERLIETYPGSPRAPAALLKLGLLAERQGKTAEARLHYQRLIASYGDSEEAKLAREKINRF